MTTCNRFEAEGLERFVERRFEVRCVHLIEIDVVSL